MKKILILLFTLAMCQGNLFGQTENNTYNRWLKPQVFGKVGGNTGSIIFTGTTSGNVTLKSADIAGTWSLTLPSTAGTANYPLLTNGSGVTSWGILPPAGGGTGTGTAFTQGSVVFAGASGIYSQDNSGLFFNPTDNYLGIGTATPSAPLHLSKTYTDASIGIGVYSDISFSNTTNNNGNYWSAYFKSTKTDNNPESGGALKGVVAEVVNAANGSISGSLAISGVVENVGIGAIADARGINIDIINGGGGTITTAYGVKINSLAGTTQYGFYNDISGSINRFLSLNLGNPSATAGSLVYHNATNSNTVTIGSGVTSASYSLTLPTAVASVTGQVLTSTDAGVLSWTTPISGITVGTTTITSGTTLRIPYNLAGVYQEQANFTIGSVATGWVEAPAGFAVLGQKCITNIPSGFHATDLLLIGRTETTTATVGNIGSIVVGYSALANGEYSIAIGSGGGLGAVGATAGQWSLAIGGSAGTSASANATRAVALGIAAANFDNSVAIGNGAVAPAANTFCLGGASSGNGGAITNVYFNNATSATPQSITLDAADGSAANGASITINGGAGGGTDKNGGALNLNGGTSSGAGTGGSIVLSTAGTAGTGTGVNAVTPRFTITTTGSIDIPKTIDVTAGDAATIDKVVGRFRKDATGSTFTLTNALITANSIILLTYASDPGITGFDHYVVAGAGSAVITFTTSGVAAAPANDTDVNFIVIN